MSGKVGRRFGDGVHGLLVHLGGPLALPSDGGHGLLVHLGGPLALPSDGGHGHLVLLGSLGVLLEQVVDQHGDGPQQARA